LSRGLVVGQFSRPSSCSPVVSSPCPVLSLASGCLRRARCLAMDKLEEIFHMQDALNRRIGVNLPPPTDDEKAKWILNYTRAMQQETAELIDSVPWKWWAKYQKFDEQNAKVEVVDLFHFLVSLAQTLGMTADDVYQAYLKKNAVNHARQETGYVKKDEADSKHI
jgi:dimeric dUTPase (all-alpha-NTP-PPase superfamily)